MNVLGGTAAIRQTGETMSDPIATISDLLEPVFAGLNGGAPADPTVRPSDRADAQINGALPLAKRIGGTPRDLAQSVVDSGVLAGVASELEIAGPGFVNVTFSAEFLSTQLAAVAADDRLGVASATDIKTVVVDYSAPNVAKEMHVGHLRTTLIGDALVRMLDFLGHRVIRENHIGDWGTPFGMLIEHLVDLGEDARPSTSHWVTSTASTRKHERHSTHPTSSRTGRASGWCCSRAATSRRNACGPCSSSCRPSTSTRSTKCWACT